MNIFCDGTWNGPGSGTNVKRLHNILGGYYFAGPGTSKGTRLVGGIFGYGVADIVTRVHTKFLLEYEDGPINIFCYSRGGVAGRRFADDLAKEGHIITFLGVFDTVGSLGVPLGFWPFTIYDDYFMDHDIHPNILRAAHAIALDEHSPVFVSTPMNSREGIIEKGFAGDHGYVGRSDETLGWMLNQFAN